MIEYMSAYIDPGTGSMLLTIVIGLAVTLVYALKGVWIKLKYLLSGGKSSTASNEKIPYVIYTDSKRYWNVFKPICDEFEKRQIPLTYMTQSPDDPALTAEYKYVTCKFIGEGSKGFAILNTLKAGTLLSTTPGLDVYQWKRSKNVDRYVHIFHTATECTMYEMFALDYYDEVLLSSDMQEKYIRELEQKRNLPAKKLYTVGCTYMDELKKRYEADPDKHISGDIKTVLLAPSWGASSILNRFGSKILAALVGTGYNIVVRPHPQMKIADPKLLESLMTQFPDGDKFSWNFDNDNYEALKNSDIMITDFSGVMTDYMAIFDRPIIYADTHIDTAPYDAAWLDEPVWRLTVLDTLGAELKEENLADIKTVIDNVINNDSFAEGRKIYTDTLWNNIGHAASTTVDYLTKGE